MSDRSRRASGVWRHDVFPVCSHPSCFCLSKFRSGPVTLEAARVFHVALPLGRVWISGFLFGLPLHSASIKASLSLVPRHSLLLAGKSAQAATETDWLRRRPGRCTEDKFVFVSRAATLGGRTLSRSCQILPPFENTLHAPWKKNNLPSYSQLYLHPRPANIIAVSKRRRGRGKGGKTHGAVAFLLSSLETPPPATQKQTGRITSFLAAGLMDRRGRQRRRSSPQNNRFSSSHGFTSQTMETSVNWAFLYPPDKSRECHLMGAGISSRKGKSKDFVTVKHNNHSAFLVDMTSCMLENTDNLIYLILLLLKVLPFLPPGSLHAPCFLS